MRFSVLRRPMASRDKRTEQTRDEHWPACCASTMVAEKAGLELVN